MNLIVLSALEGVGIRWQNIPQLTISKSDLFYSGIHSENYSEVWHALHGMTDYDFEFMYVYVITPN